MDPIHRIFAELLNNWECSMSPEEQKILSIKCDVERQDSIEYYLTTTEDVSDAFISTVAVDSYDVTRAELVDFLIFKPRRLEEDFLDNWLMDEKSEMVRARLFLAIARNHPSKARHILLRYKNKVINEYELVYWLASMKLVTGKGEYFLKLASYAYDMNPYIWSSAMDLMVLVSKSKDSDLAFSILEHLCAEDQSKEKKVRITEKDLMITNESDPI